MDERTRLKYLEIASKSLAEIIKTVLVEHGEMTKLEAELFLMEALRAHVRRAIKRR